MQNVVAVQTFGQLMVYNKDIEINRKGLILMNEIIVLTGLTVILLNSVWEIGRIVMENSRRKQIKYVKAKNQT